MNKIFKSRYCGFCSGVTLAIKKASEAASGGRIYTLGPIIHNPQVVEKLRRSNIIDNDGSLHDVKQGDCILIRSHGIPLQTERALKKKNCNIIDATCPKVKKAQEIFSRLSEKYDKVFIVGVKTHPEVKGIISRAPEKSVVLTGPDQAKTTSPGKNAGIIAQTTFRGEVFFATVFEIMKKFNVVEMHNTICEETINRQKELKKLAEKVDVLFIVGGKNSSNTKRLFELGREIVDTYHVETAKEVLPRQIAGRKSVGIATGASTPMAIVEKVEKKIKKIKKSKQGEY